MDMILWLSDCTESEFPIREGPTVKHWSAYSDSCGKQYIFSLPKNASHVKINRTLIEEEAILDIVIEQRSTNTQATTR